MAFLLRISLRGTWLVSPERINERRYAQWNKTDVKPDGQRNKAFAQKTNLADLTWREKVQLSAERCHRGQ